MAKKVKEYENNPLSIALSGLNLVFERAKNVAILLIVISILGVFSSMPVPQDSTAHPAMPSWTPDKWFAFSVIVCVIVLAGIFVMSMLSGISAYTSARVAKGHTVGLSEAFHAVLDRFFSYIWLQILILVKVFLWSLLLIVPGIIMAVRYSLANVAFFDKDLQGNAAIKKSIELTRGAWLTTYAAQSLFNILTLGVISELVATGARANLYRQLSELGEDTQPPKAHPLSWLTLFLPIIFLFTIIVCIVVFGTLLMALGIVLR